MTQRFLILTFLIMLSFTTYAQVPQSINYQAVARNNSGQALSNQTINVRLSILEGASSLYSETRSVITNALGLFNVKIGSAGATSTTGSFTNIGWSLNIPDTKFIKVELDVNNTNTFTDMGTQSLATVPFAFAADNAIKIGGFQVGAGEPNNEDVLQWGGSEWQPGALKIGTKPVSNTVPTTGDLLIYNGTSWIPKPSPKIQSVAGTIAAIPFGGGAAPWVFAGPTTTVTVTAGQQVSGNATGVFGHGNSSNPQPCSWSVCWSETPAGSPLSAFSGSAYPDGFVTISPEKSALTANAVWTFPNAGNYKVGFCLKNKSTNTNFGANDYANGVFIVH